jgi:hypothetical protein
MKPGRGAWAGFLLVAAAGAVYAAPPEEAIIPVERYSTEKAKLLASTHKMQLRQIYDNVYRCYEWMDIRRLSFVSPKEATGDDRYLTLWVEIVQQMTPAFAAAPPHRRASTMFQHYGIDLLRRTSSHQPFLRDPALAGFGVILTWTKPGGEPKREAPGVNETLALFVDKTTLERFLQRQTQPAEFVRRAIINGFDGTTRLGRFALEIGDAGPPRPAVTADGRPAC